MIVRLIQVVLALFVVSVLVRLVRRVFGPTPRRDAPRERPGLDPTKRVAASWSEVGSEREGGKTD